MSAHYAKTPTINYSMLECLGISAWVRRSMLLEFKNPLWGAPLAVILSEKIEDKTEEYKVFTGMLNVLMLNTSRYWIGWFKEPINIENNENPTRLTQNLIDEIKVWGPKNVLLLGQRFEEMEKIKNEIKEGQLFISYHPKELVIHPHYKKTAYQELLRLKERLH